MVIGSDELRAMTGSFKLKDGRLEGQAVGSCAGPE
jgi:hypothetical protein